MSFLAALMWKSATLLPMPREPEWRNVQTRSFFVEHDFDEVVAGPQGAELPAPVPVSQLLVEVELSGLGCLLLQLLWS